MISMVKQTWSHKPTASSPIKAIIGCHIEYFFLVGILWILTLLPYNIYIFPLLSQISVDLALQKSYRLFDYCKELCFTLIYIHLILTSPDNTMYCTLKKIMKAVMHCIISTTYFGSSFTSTSFDWQSYVQIHWCQLSLKQDMYPCT